MRLAFSALALISLGACSQVPDSAAGIGFNNSIAEQRARQADLAARSQATISAPAGIISSEQAAPPSAPVPTVAAAPSVAPVPAPAPVATAQALPAATPPAPQTAPAQTDQDVILEAAAALDQRSANSGELPLQASPSNPAPQIVGNPGLSDENDFQAVSQRESIASDADRIAQNRAQYQQVQPTAVPTRNGLSQPNIVQYALQTQHAKGTRVYRRAGINLAARSRRNCAGFASADLAQIAFLESGGPQRDRKALDPDGDGFACSWDPAPFRSAVRN